MRVAVNAEEDRSSQEDATACTRLKARVSPTSATSRTDSFGRIQTENHILLIQNMSLFFRIICVHHNTLQRTCICTEGCDEAKAVSLEWAVIKHQRPERNCRS